MKSDSKLLSLDFPGGSVVICLPVQEMQVLPLTQGELTCCGAAVESVL